METELADNEIRSRLADGDPTALHLIWDRYHSDLLGYLMSIVCSRHDGEDALQDVFVTIARKRKSVAKARMLKAYLFRLARNVALNRIKRTRRSHEREQMAADWLVSTEDCESPDERKPRLEAALAALPEKQRTVVVMKFYREKNLREIGELLGISENTAASRLRYGMEKLEKLLKEPTP